MMDSVVKMSTNKVSQSYEELITEYFTYNHVNNVIDDQNELIGYLMERAVAHKEISMYDQDIIYSSLKLCSFIASLQREHQSRLERKEVQS